MIPPTSIDGTDITGATIDGTDVTEITVDGDVVFSAGAVSGTYYYSIPDQNTGEVEYFSLATPFDLPNKGSPDFTLQSSLNEVNNMSISNDGTTFYVVEDEVVSNTNKTVEEFSLSTPFDLQSAQSQGTFAPPFAPIGFARTCFDFADDETRFYTNDGNGNMVQFDLSTPFDPTTGTQSGSLGPFASSGPGSPSFSPDGTQMAFGQRGGSTIRGGTLSTPFDISTFTQTDTFTTSDADPCSVRWNSDGTTLYVRHASPNMVNEFSTPNPYSINGLSFVQQVFANPNFAVGHDFNYNY
jgi:hypothetical protein